VKASVHGRATLVAGSAVLPPSSLGQSTPALLTTLAISKSAWNFRRGVAATRALVFAVTSLALAQAGSSHQEFPDEFCIATEVISDASPFWFKYILHLSSEGNESVVRWIRIAPLSGFCDGSVTVKAATARLRVSPTSVVRRARLCSQTNLRVTVKVKLDYSLGCPHCLFQWLDA